MSILQIRDFYFYLYFFLTFFVYAFFLRFGEPLGALVYFLFLGGSAVLFIICFIDVFLKKSGVVSVGVFLAFSAAAGAFLFDYAYHRSSNIINFVFFIVIAWSFYKKPSDHSLHILNFVFLIAVLWSISSYYIGLNRWGFFPGQAQTNLAQGLWWRVGLFPFQTPPFSGAFALVVFFGNLGSRGFFRSFLIISSLYFALFSASRTILAALLLGIFVVFLSRKHKVSPFVLLLILLSSTSLLIVLSNFPSTLAPLVSWNDMLASFVLRVGESGAGGGVDQDSRSIIFFLFLEHISSHWPFGVGGNIFAEVYEGPGGSEMPGFRILVESGISGAVSLFSICSFALFKSVGGKVFFIMFFILLFFYGSFLHPYSLIYLSMLILFKVKC